MKQANLDTPNLYMLFDPTIWAYAVLVDKQGKQLKLHGFQDKIINDKHRYVVVAGANQIGKSWTICIKAVHHALYVPNASVLIVSRSEQQAIYMLDEIKWMMRRANMPFNSVIDEVENRTELHITNTDKKGVSVIRCLPCTEAVLSYPATLMICDEIGFWDIQNSTQVKYFNRVIVSRTNATKNWTNDHFTMGQIVCISNPNGQNGVLWELWNDVDCNQYRYCWLANPDNTIEEYSTLKNKIPPDEFDSVYAATFSSTTGGFITGAEYNDAIKVPYDMAMPTTQSIYLGADFAGEDTVSRNVDSTVIFGAVQFMDGDVQKYKIIYLNEFPQKSTKADVVYPEIIRLKNNYSIAGFGYDKQGVGDSVKNDLKDKGVLPEYLIESFTYSLPNKSEIYYNMQHIFEQRRVKLPDHPKLKEQLMGLRFKRTEAGHLGKPSIMVHHEKEGLHDDYPDALANCLWMASRFGSGISVSFVETIAKKETKYTGPRKAITCRICENYRYSSNPDDGVCDYCA